MASKERGLGKGLGALLGDAALQDQPSGTITVPISQIEPGLKQPRKRFEAEAIAQLADSIREHGLIQPLTVRRLASGYYQIIAGERRWRASKEAGLTELPVMVIEADDKKVMELGLIENLQREDLNPMEIAKGYRSLMDDYGMTQETVAQRMGVSRPVVANALRLLALPDSVQAMLEEGKLSAGHAKAILMAPGAANQETLAQLAVEKGLSVREVESIAHRLAKPAAEKPKPTAREREIELYYTDLERILSEDYGRKVTFKRGGKKNYLQLEYYGLDDLEALLNRLKGGSSL